MHTTENTHIAQQDATHCRVLTRCRVFTHPLLRAHSPTVAAAHCRRVHSPTVACAQRDRPAVTCSLLSVRPLRAHTERTPVACSYRAYARAHYIAYARAHYRAYARSHLTTYRAYARAHYRSYTAIPIEQQTPLRARAFLASRMSHMPRARRFLVLQALSLEALPC